MRPSRPELYDIPSYSDVPPRSQEECGRRLGGAIWRHCQQRHLQMPLQVDSDHPVEQVGRLLLAAVLRQTGLHRRLAAFVTGAGRQRGGEGRGGDGW